MKDLVEEEPQNYEIEKKNEINSYPIDIPQNKNVPIQNNYDFDISTNEAEQIENSIRLNFIRKVYGILSIQLTIRFLMCALTFIKTINEFIIANKYLINLSFIIQIGLVFVIIINSCFGNNLLRVTPYNYIILFTYTFSLSYMISFICAFLNPQIIILAVCLTMIVTLALTVYALKMKNEFSVGKCFVLILICNLIEFFFCAFFTRLTFVYSFELILGIFVYSVYLIYDTQLIYSKIGRGYNIDDYILAALNIYIDIIQLFIRILQILAKLSKK